MLELHAVLVGDDAADDDGHVVGAAGVEQLDDARDELCSALSATADSLIRLGGAKAQEHELALSRLPLHQKRQQRILRKLERLLRERTEVG